MVEGEGSLSFSCMVKENIKKKFQRERNVAAKVHNVAYILNILKK